MKTKTLMIGLVLTALVLAPIAMAAEEPPQRGPRGQEGRPAQGPRSMRGFGGGFDPIGRILERLDLTAEQQKKIDAIRDENQDKGREARNAIREAMQALNEAVDDGTESKIIAAGKAVGEAQTQAALLRAKTTKQIKAVLTEEQLAKLKEIQAEMRERMQQRFQGGEGTPARGTGRAARGRRQAPPEDE